MFIDQGYLLDDQGNKYQLTPGTTTEHYIPVWVDLTNQAAFANNFTLEYVLVDPLSGMINGDVSKNTKFSHWTITSLNANATLTAYGNYMQLFGLHNSITFPVAVNSKVSCDAQNVYRIVYIKFVCQQLDTGAVVM